MPQIDNSCLAEKVYLRVDNLPPGPVSLLDCYGGYGIVWREAIRASGRTDIVRTAIDQERRRGAIKGDNRKWLKSLDLSQYNVIDLDAYGVPFDQMKILFDRKYSGVVYFTFIQSSLGRLPGELLGAGGIPKDMIDKCPTLWGQYGWQIWCDWLAGNGVRRLSYCNSCRKWYGCFKL